MGGGKMPVEVWEKGSMKARKKKWKETKKARVGGGCVNGWHRPERRMSTKKYNR